MACTILIHAKNWNEKMEILGSFHDNLNYEVITDLKRYVAERYKVRIVEEEEDGGSGGVNMVPMAVENMDIRPPITIVRYDQMTGMEGNALSTIVQVGDSYGTPIPSRERNNNIINDNIITDVLEADQLAGHGNGINSMINPPGAVPELLDILDVEGLDPIDNTPSIDNILSPADNNDEDPLLAPLIDEEVHSDDKEQENDSDSGSEAATPATIRRSARFLKRSRADESDDENYNSIPKAITAAVRKHSKNVKNHKEIECQKCLRKLGSHYRDYKLAVEHVAIHVDMIRFECPVKGCGFKCGPRQTAKTHIRTKHKKQKNCEPPKTIDLTSEQRKKLDDAVKECFPVFDTPKIGKVCGVCNETIVNDSLDGFELKQHLQDHINVMLYKCTEEKCRFKSKYYKEMMRHGWKKHRIERMEKEEMEIELTSCQRKAIDDMMKRCFPDEDADD